MRIVRVRLADGSESYGRLEGERVLRIRGDLFTELVETAEELQPVKRLAPVAPRNIIAIGLNYREHARETGKPIPTDPVVFAKLTTSLNHPGDPILLPAVSRSVDFECELAVVIGRVTRDVSPARALEYVFGYTCANDVSERYWQQHLGQWVRAKSFDTFCPLGPWIETAIADPNALRIRTILNGQVMQDSTTADMIFPVAELVSFLSRDLTLLPGTVILTGTPPGVGVARKPPVFLKDGDTVTVSIEGLGELTNPVRAAGGRE